MLGNSYFASLLLLHLLSSSVLFLHFESKLVIFIRINIICATALTMISDYMGHDVSVHRAVYRTPELNTHVTKLAKFFMAVGDPDINRFRGKTLEELEVFVENEEQEEPQESVADDELHETVDDNPVAKTETPTCLDDGAGTLSAQESVVVNRKLKKQISMKQVGALDEVSDAAPTTRTPQKRIPSKQKISPRPGMVTPPKRRCLS